MRDIGRPDLDGVARARGMGGEASRATTAEEFNRQSMAVGHQIQLEDVEICEDVQRGLGSRSFTAGRYRVRRESGVYHFHQLLNACLSRARQ